MEVGTVLFSIPMFKKKKIKKSINYCYKSQRLRCSCAAGKLAINYQEIAHLP